MDPNIQLRTVPLLDLKAQYRQIRDEVRDAVDRVMESQQFILGPEVQALEQEIAAYCGCRYAVGVSSGTDALIASLMALGVGPGDEVITTPFSFFATVGAIVRLGATPVFVDIHPRDFNINANEIEAMVTKRTKAIIPVHLFGQMADMSSIMETADKHGIPIVEDAAQAIGSECQGKRAGSFGAAGCFSFFPSKNLGGFGDGGLVATNDEALAQRLRIIRNQGADPKYYHKALGGNFRLDALQAAVLRVKLKYLDAWTEGRRANASYYTKRFTELGLTDGYIAPPPIVRERHVFNQYVIRARDRDALRSFLAEHGVSTEIYYPLPLHRQECISKAVFARAALPESEKAASEVLALPIYPELSDDDKEYVVQLIAHFYRAKEGAKARS
ncbi:MAG: DegT/DnrJ/EryC1/StrS family aminotransferase [Desulfomonilaceae bacterium]